MVVKDDKEEKLINGHIRYLNISHLCNCIYISILTNTSNKIHKNIESKNLLTLHSINVLSVKPLMTLHFARISSILPVKSTILPIFTIVAAKLFFQMNGFLAF